MRLLLLGELPAGPAEAQQLKDILVLLHIDVQGIAEVRHTEGGEKSAKIPKLLFV